MRKDKFVFLPVGWGFMLIHNSYAKRFYSTVITDGGTIFQCLNALRFPRSNPYIVPMNRWCWILTHLDYDHFSITTSLIKKSIWRPPSLVILPEVYSEKTCRETLAYMLTLEYIIALLLRVPMPRYIDVFNSLRNSKQLLGVKQGDKIALGEVMYRILWPPPARELGPICRKLKESIMKKIKQYCERLGEHYEGILQRFRRCVENVFSRIRPASDSREVILQLDNILSKPFHKKPPRLIEVEENIFRRNEKMEVYSAKLLLEKAAKKFYDKQLSRLHINVLNLFSIAYNVEILRERKNIHHVIDLDIVSRIISLKGKLIAREAPLILYPSDLQGNQLDKMLDYYLKTCSSSYSLIVEAAPHHGNSYNRKLKYLIPTITYIPRCNLHVPESWMRNYAYLKRTHTTGIVIQSNHTIQLELNLNSFKF